MDWQSTELNNAWRDANMARVRHSPGHAYAAGLAQHGRARGSHARCRLAPEAVPLARDFANTTLVVEHRTWPIGDLQAGFGVCSVQTESLAAGPNVVLKPDAFTRLPVDDQHPLFFDSAQACTVFGTLRTRCSPIT